VTDFIVQHQRHTNTTQTQTPQTAYASDYSITVIACDNLTGNLVAKNVRLQTKTLLSLSAVIIMLQYAV